ncbi:LPS export ABC transporter periplasmic protein LptC [Sulfurimonas sp. SAG-AH-194-L11]|nr:LPS export ABC transporter periplasmic protein LptC [Sulfurimonas sp. SAG-AH-194-L11]MDF1876923.1 LPS export ABC transporter periplasmic protein LptC [Sulfurimonas sp. SAG-AH-194-L11]
MNINIFFISIFSALMLIYIFFQPLKIKEQEFKDVPLLVMDNFTMYELQSSGLQTNMSGSNALRYSDRYIIKNINFTDNSKEFISNMQANSGVYKDEIVDLRGEVMYTREDGLTFESDTLEYNTKSAIAQTNDDYIAYKGNNSMRGVSFIYDSLNNTMKSKKVVVKYQLKESKI